MQTSEMKPCPFCGGEATVREYPATRIAGKPNGDSQFGVDCTNCGIETGKYMSDGPAIADWNRRALSPSPPEKGLGVPSDRVPPSDERSAMALGLALADLVQLCEFATFDNGVHSPDGRSEADYWAVGALDHARDLLKRLSEHQALPEHRSALTSRLKYRLDVLIERSGTEENAITSRGIGISYLFAREIYKELEKATGGEPRGKANPSSSPSPVGLREALEELNARVDAMWNDKTAPRPGAIHEYAICQAQQMARAALQPHQDGGKG